MRYCRFSKSRLASGEREARRRLEDCTPSRFACQEPAVSRFRFLLLSVVSRTAQARSHSGVYHNFEPLSSPRSLPFLSTAFLFRQPLRSSSQSGSYHNSEPLSRPRSIAFSSTTILPLPFGEPAKGSRFDSRILPQPRKVVKTPQFAVFQYHVLGTSFVETAKVSRFDPESLPQPRKVVKPLQYHVPVHSGEAELLGFQGAFAV